MLKVKKSESTKLNGKLKYEFVDTMGSFVKSRQRGLNSDNQIVVKSKIFSESKSDYPVEKLISISKDRKRSGDLKLLSPVKSEVVYWFDGKRYKSTITVNDKEIV